MYTFNRKFLPLLCLLIGAIVSSPVVVPGIIRQIQNSNQQSASTSVVEEFKQQPEKQSEPSVAQPSEEKTTEEEATPKSAIEFADETVNQLTTAQKASAKQCTVTEVTDGDTIKVNCSGRTIRVRLIGVNTPETVHPTKPQECFGPEASDYLKGKLTNQSVTLVTDPSQDTYDVYNRLLAYVYLDDQNINYRIIRRGYGYEYTYKVPYLYQSEFQTAENYASSNNLGLWSPSTCSGQK